MIPRSTHLSKVAIRAAAFFAASYAAVGFQIGFGKIFWPTGLSGGADHIFWPATGINVAGVLILGLAYWPVILLDALPGWLMGEPLAPNLIGASGNAVEALVAGWIIRRLGAFAGDFGQMRSVLSLLLASVVAPLICSLTFPLYLLYTGRFSVPEFWTAIGNWNLANGAAMLLLAPFLVAVGRGSWNFPRVHWQENSLWIAAGLAGCAIAFSAVFSDQGMNFVFLVFPLVIFTAVRFGPQEMAASLVLVMLSIYGALAFYAGSLSNEMTPKIVWFLQAFCWVISATGLVVAALVRERSQAEQRAREEQSRTLELSLREEQARLGALRYQINPHFLFNALNSIRATIPLSETVPREMVTSLSDYFRTTLSDPETHTAPLRDEVASVEHYLAIEKQRFGEDLQVTLSIAPAVMEKIIPIFLIQPLVENAIHHGLASSSGRMELKLSAGVTAQNLVIEVANSGSWKAAESAARSGVGLDNIKRRLSLIHGEKAHLKLTANDGWVSATITLPLED